MKEKEREQQRLMYIKESMDELDTLIPIIKKTNLILDNAKKNLTNYTKAEGCDRFSNKEEDALEKIWDDLCNSRNDFIESSANFLESLQTIDAWIEIVRMEYHSSL